MTRFALALVFVVGLLPLAAATARANTLQIIAQPGDVIDGRTITRFNPEDNPVALNNSREVVFMASVDGPSNWSVMTPDRFIAGAGKVVDGVVPQFDNEDHRFSINNNGQVAYKAAL